MTKKTHQAKTYQSLGYLIYQQALRIDDKNVFCDFVGGVTTPVLTMGTFSTSDPKIQEALESREAYGTQYICISEPEKKEPEEETKETIPETKEDKEETLEAEIVKGIVNSQQARNYLAKKYEEITYSMLKNKTMVLAVAEKYKIEFPDWDK